MQEPPSQPRSMFGCFDMPPLMRQDGKGGGGLPVPRERARAPLALARLRQRQHDVAERRDGEKEGGNGSDAVGAAQCIASGRVHNVGCRTGLGPQ